MGTNLDNSVTAQSATALYRSVAPQLIHCGDASIAVRRYGTGPALLLIHGFPTNSFTWYAILPQLAESFSCYAGRSLRPCQRHPFKFRIGSAFR